MRSPTSPQSRSSFCSSPNLAARKSRPRPPEERLTRIRGEIPITSAGSPSFRSAALPRQPRRPRCMPTISPAGMIAPRNTKRLKPVANPVRTSQRR